jgi:hypothetical protein
VTDRDIVTRGRLAEADAAVGRSLSIHDDWVFAPTLAVDRAHVVMPATG